MTQPLSMYVVKTTHDNEPVLFNTVTKKILPVNASDEDLAQHLFLKGQEREAIAQGLKYQYGALSIIAIPTWECNLRCKHCSVLTLLKENQTDHINIDKFIDFVKQHINMQVFEWVSLDFVGGEPLLRPADCLEILTRTIKLCDDNGIKFAASVTTNATVEFTPTHWEFLDLLSDMAVSVDGNQEQHNAQRIPLHHAFDDPYSKTLANIESMLDRGYGDKLRIKAAVEEKFVNRENHEAFLKKFAYMGVKVTNINYGCHHPTDHTDPKSLINFKNKFATQPIAMPCCKYRLTNVYLVEPNNEIYDVPFKWAKNKLGMLGDDVKEIISKREQAIAENFVCYDDYNCMKCPVIGYCWGGCVTANPLHKGKPSDYCHQTNIMRKVEKSAEEGTLIQHTMKKLPLNLLATHYKVPQTS